ncbi:hypothetical protein GCM10010168_53230 [Actinoplanes ianthinogenes]|uniref:Phage-related protein n=1 Tax=Actinoplanes ianthinogenes TaxID=122358 RepID=A0ABN6CBD5_9ACTN|nr:hypothetical protein [Actinoplanes ianthinogenes]BCJ41679.1 hypothetical protein Aiant_23360 [Actinoplanes ianthinogenes]GGR28459.1 hypothetical protein GCM10010168_53230 [Actinoplanes ianthinogenes]
MLSGLSSAFSAAGKLAGEFATNVSEALREGGKVALSAVTGLISTAAGTAATGGLNLLLGALIAISAALPIAIGGFLALAPAIYLVGGAAGSLFTLATGGIATMVVLGMATHGLGDAFKELGEKGKVSRETLDKLAPAAAKFVQKVAEIKKPFGELTKYVQSRVFRDLAGVLDKLWKRWQKPLFKILGGVGNTINGVIRQIGAGLSKKSFISNITKATAGFDVFLARLGKSAGPLIDTFGRLAAAAVPFLTQLGDLIGGVIDRFSAWVATADKSGKLTGFFTDAAQALRDIWAIGGLSFKIIGDIVRILFPSAKSASGSVLGGVRTTLEDIHTWLSDPKNVAAIQNMIDKIKDFAKKAVTEWIPAVANFFSEVGKWMDKVAGWGQKWDDFKRRVSIALGAALAIARSTISGIVDQVKRIADPLRSAGAAFGRFKSAVKTHIAQAIAAVQGLPAKIVGALTGLPGQLYDAGKQAVAGFVRGLLSDAGGLIGAGTSLGRMALNAAKNALDINSPSRKMAELGTWATKGFVVGMVGGLDEVKKTAERLAEKALSALRAKGLSESAANKRVNALTKALAPKQKQIDALAKKWDALAAKISDAKQKLADAIQARSDFSAAVRSSVIDTGSITSIDAGNSSGIIASMRAQLVRAQKWASVLGQLRKQGLNDTTYRQLVEAGPDSLEIAETLLKGGKSAIGEVNTVQKQLASVASSVGGQASAALYDSGVNAARGLVKGLESQQAAIEKIMEKIAKSMVKTIKKQLGIKSPSRVLMKLGSFSGEGYAKGLQKSGRKVTKAYSALTTLPDVQAPHAGATTAASSGPLIGSLTLAASKETVRDQLDEVTWTLRRIRRGGVYA